MGFRHGVGEGDVVLVLHLLHGQMVVLVGGLRLQRGQGHPTAADHHFSHGVDDVAADGADVKLGPQQVGREVAVADGVPRHQLQHRDPQGGGQGGEQGDVRQALARLPLGDGFVAHIDLCRQLGLGELSGLSQLLDGASGYIGVHSCAPFLKLTP